MVYYSKCIQTISDYQLSDYRCWFLDPQKKKKKTGRLGTRTSNPPDVNSPRYWRAMTAHTYHDLNCKQFIVCSYLKPSFSRSRYFWAIPPCLVIVDTWQHDRIPHRNFDMQMVPDWHSYSSKNACSLSKTSRPLNCTEKSLSDYRRTNYRQRFSDPRTLHALHILGGMNKA